jgi:ADP-heptose:LPS heptosyltransferase
MKLWFERGAWASQFGRRTIQEMVPEQVKRIAVIRHAALGDMVLVRPFLVEVRKFFPNAEIVLSLVSNYTYGAPVDLADSVHIAHGSHEKNVTIRERVGKAKELGNVDILFDLADTTRSRYLCLLTKAKVKIGFPYRWYQRHLLLDAAVPRSDFSFEAVTMLDALMLLGANPEFPLNFAWPKELVDRAEPRQKTVIYFPFASVPSKCWPTDRFLSLIAQAATNYPSYNHVVLAGVGAHEHVNDYAVLAQKHANVNLQQPMSLDETIKFLAKSGLVVSNDTGVRNLAISLDTPTLGIFYSTVPYRYWPRYGSHFATFNPAGKPPEVQDVFNDLSKALAS